MGIKENISICPIDNPVASHTSHVSHISHISTNKLILRDGRSNGRAVRHRELICSSISSKNQLRSIVYFNLPIISFPLKLTIQPSRFISTISF